MLFFMTFPVLLSLQLLKRLADRYQFYGFAQHFGNILSALRQRPGIKLLAMGGLQALGCFPFFTKSAVKPLPSGMGI